MPSSPQLITAPAAEPVALADARLHLRIDDDQTAEDRWILRAIRGLREQAEHETGRKLITQVWDMVLDAFPASGEAIRLHPELSPLQAVVHIQYQDTAGLVQTVDAAGYGLDAQSAPGYVFPAAGVAWPGDVADAANAVRVRLRVGYGDAAADVPDDLVHWMLMHLETAYKVRGTVAAAVTLAEVPGRYADRLLDPYRVMGL